MPDTRITCKQCLAKLCACPANEHGWHNAKSVYEVGNPARPSMGHAMYFTDAGLIVLCVAPRRARLLYLNSPIVQELTQGRTIDMD